MVASLLALKHSFEKEWLGQNALRILLLAINAPDHLQKQFVIYLFGRSEMEEKKVIEMFESLSLDYKKNFVSTLDHLKEAGKMEGRKEGEEKKSTEFVRNMLLTGRFSVDEIASLANVTEAFVLRVKESL